jgi:autotransporter-associated beta strand protein
MSQLRIVFALMLFLSPALAAQTFTVTTLNDTGAGSLRSAIISANAATSAATIQFNISGGGTVVIGSDMPIINNRFGLSVSGANAGQGSITISGNNAYRPFFFGVGTGEAAAATGFGTLQATTNTNYSLSDLTIINGLAKGGNGGQGAIVSGGTNASGGGGAGLGGAIFLNAGSLTLNGISFQANLARGGNGGVGVLDNDNSFGTGGGGGMGGDGGAGMRKPGSGAPPFLTGAQRKPGGGGGFGSLALGYSERNIPLNSFGAGSFTGGAPGGGPGGAEGGGGDSTNSGQIAASLGGGVGASGTSGAFGGGGGGGANNLPDGNGGYGGGGAGQNGAPGFAGGASSGGGGSGFGGAVFVRQGASILINDGLFSSSTVQAGANGGPGSASAGQALGADLFLAGNASYFVSAGNTITLNGDIGGVTNALSTGGLTKLGPGMLVLNAANTFVGPTSISAGTIRLGHALALQNSTVNVNNNFTFASGITAATFGGLAGNENFTLGAGATFALTVGGNNASTTYSGVLSQQVGSVGSLTKIGTGTLTFSGANIFTGGTTVSGGKLQLNASGSISGPVALNNTAMLVINRTDPSSLNFTAPITGNGSLQVMSGTLTLSGENTFSGGTTITGGRLVANTVVPTNSATGSGPVTLSGGTLAGTGRVAGAISILPGAFLQAGDGSSLGSPTLTTGPITFGNGFAIQQGTLTDLKFTVNPNSPGVNTKLVAGGLSPLDLDYDSLRFRIRLDGAAVSLGVNRSGPWVLATFPNQSSLPTGTFTNNNPLSYELVSDVSNITFSAWSITVSSSSITLNSFTPVPEPATVLGFVTLCVIVGNWWRGIPLRNSNKLNFASCRVLYLMDQLLLQSRKV